MASDVPLQHLLHLSGKNLPGCHGTLGSRSVSTVFVFVLEAAVMVARNGIVDRSSMYQYVSTYMSANNVPVGKGRGVGLIRNPVTASSRSVVQSSMSGFQTSSTVLWPGRSRD